jgi:hypothetical protein
VFKPNNRGSINMKAPTNTLTKSLIPLVLLTMSGCGEMKYKQGATAADLKQATLNCSTDYMTRDSTNISKQDLDACLSRNGWLVVNADKPVLPEVMENSEDVALNQLEPIMISAWWKAGTSAQQLMVDGEKCSADLGDEHQTKNNMSLVTQGIVTCMKKMEWVALKQ